MASFRKMCEDMRPGRDFWDRRRDHDGGLDERAMAVITRGLEVRPERSDGDTFWDDFVSVIANNSDDAAHLLGVSSSTISRWAARIREGLDLARERNSGDTEMVQTGDSPRHHHEGALHLLPQV